jgi:hypothetical protein
MGWFHTSSYVNITKYRLIMINTFSTKTETPNTECIVVSGKVTPEFNYMQLFVEKSLLTEEQKTIYANAINLIAGRNMTIISDTIENLNIDRITSDEIIEGTYEFDFQSISEADKNKIEELIMLFVELSIL